jgi:DNA polymerase-1
VPGLPENVFKDQRDALYRQGGNSPIQGTNADITKLAMIQVQDILDTYKFRANLMIQIHDEIVLLAHKSQSSEVKRLVEESMLDAAKQVLKKVPVKVESYISDYWEK